MDLIRLCKLFIEIMKNENLNDVTSVGAYSNPSSFWGKLCVAYHGHFEKQKSLLIKHKYKFNYGKFKDMVESQLSSVPLNVETVEMELEQNENCLKLELTSREWQKIQKFIYKSRRKTFRAGFTHFLSNKLQLNGVNCYLSHRNSNNWFKASSWRGLYKCVGCDIRFLCVIPDLSVPNIQVVITWTTDRISQHVLIKSKEQCRGTRRKEYAVKLAAHGVSNVRSNMIVQNHFKGNYLV